MGVHAARRTSAREAEPLADVLVSGGTEPPYAPPAHRRHLTSAALLLAVVLVLGVPAWLSGTDRDGVGPVSLALRDGVVPVLRRDGPPVWGLLHGGVHVEVVNEGSEPVRLLSSALSPGQWHATVADDLARSADPDGRGRLLRPGWSAVLVLHRSVLCASGADLGPTPTHLELGVEVDGRAYTSVLDVSSTRPADGIGLQDVLAAPTRFCAAVRDRAAPGTVGDRAAQFLDLWPAGRWVVRSP